MHRRLYRGSSSAGGPRPSADAGAGVDGLERTGLSDSPAVVTGESPTDCMTWMAIRRELQSLQFLTRDADPADLIAARMQMAQSSSWQTPRSAPACQRSPFPPGGE
ncbi:hypothetical protein, partial [Micromonospora tulbaghiae]|uniref:hypothetical protein n=1 Tax=Micromonospora tulbaghiae TaxID=479978 RepID=UPI003EC0A5B1